MTRWLVATWLAVIVPFGLAAATGGPEGPWGHIGFHIVYIAFAIAAIVFTLLLRRTSSDRLTRVAALVVACTQALVIAGQVGELVVVFSQHGPDIGEEAMHDPMHDVASTALTAPGLLLTAVALIALTVIFSRRSKKSGTTVVVGNDRSAP